MSALAQAAYAPAAQPLAADATGQLYERHHRRIFGFCLRLLGSREDAEDAVQTTFINAQRGLHRGVVPEFELAWLFTIARNVCSSSRQSSSRRRRLEMLSDLDALQDLLATPERDASVSIGELAHALGAIPERQRRALVLREFQGLSYDEIAVEFGVSVSAVETLIFRARRSVAEQLERTSKAFGPLSWVLAGVRWLIKGGAAPLKLAAATATVATTATLALVPLAADHAPARAPVSPAPAVKANWIQPAQVTGVSRHSLRRPVAPTSGGRAPTVVGAVQSSGQPPVAPPQARTDATNTAAAADSGLKAAAPPAVIVPSSAIPPVTTPVNVTVPEVTLPAITVPAITSPQVDLQKIELPVQQPKLPDLPKLP